MGGGDGVTHFNATVARAIEGMGKWAGSGQQTDETELKVG